MTAPARRLRRASTHQPTEPRPRGFYFQSDICEILGVGTIALQTMAKQYSLYEPFRSLPSTGPNDKPKLRYHRRQAELIIGVAAAPHAQQQAELRRAEEEWKIRRPAIAADILAELDRYDHEQRQD